MKPCKHENYITLGTDNGRAVWWCPECGASARRASMGERTHEWQLCKRERDNKFTPGELQILVEWAMAHLSDIPGKTLPADQQLLALKLLAAHSGQDE